MSSPSKWSNTIRKEVLTRTKGTPRSRKIPNMNRKRDKNTPSPPPTPTATTRIKNIPSLHEFMHKQKVKSQYRQFFKAMQMIQNDDTAKSSIQQEIRTSYKSVMNETDKLAISMAVTEGERRLKEFKSMVGYRDSSSSSSRTSNGNENDEEEDSWLKIQDEDDPRGRVGTNWPWNSK